MSRLSASIPKQPERQPAEDFYRLRREGIGFIEEMGSRLWTDYNSHDPGITTLEALCYAITDLAYRIGWDIKDILAPPAADPDNPFLNQPFFTAQEILTVNPLTPNDFRRLLIDLDTVRNAWVVCKQCACGTGCHARCENDQLTLSYKKYSDNDQYKEVAPLGLYDVLLELEADPELGDLNDRKIEQSALFHEYFSDEDKPHILKMELRFPELSIEYREEWKLFEDNDIPCKVTLSRFSEKGNPLNLLQENDEGNKKIYLKDHGRDVFSVGFQIMFSFSEIPDTIICVDNATLRLFGDSYVKNKITLVEIQNKLENGDFIDNYDRKLRKVEKAVTKVKKTLHQHRNLDEDYCCIRVVDVEDVAVCADVELTPDADIERVQARIWFEIEQYFNPPVPFYSLQELMTAEVPVEEIFNGPQLKNGFIKAEELEAAELKTVLRTSDVINRLMDIDGVAAINNLLLSHYDAEGKVIKGRVDPGWSNDKPVFDPDKSNAEWVLFVTPMHQPRLYHNQSRFLFFKNGLPFKARMDEAQDTLIQLRGKADRPKISNADETNNNLAAPTGTYRDLSEYFPLQYSLPVAYGIGPEGLPAHASSYRQAQARQLKAYLMAFEQLIANAFAQLAHTADLFSLDPEQKHTYFVHQLSEEIIKGYDEIMGDLDQDELEDMSETRPEFLQRRNRFLDHIMARFGEQFSEYALMLTNSEGKQVALEQLIEDKIHFLKEYPQISGERSKAFDYTKNLCPSDNSAILKKRISLLLGSPEEISERAILVEHLLLRPKFPGDALYPVCSDGACKTCGDEDPYSFRLTFVMPGWTEPYNTDMAMRAFAEQTIRRETPSHLLGKICWVGNDSPADAPDEPGQFERFEDAWCTWLEVNARFDWPEERIRKELESFLADHLKPDEATTEAAPEEKKVCICAAEILALYGQGFHEWMIKNVAENKPLEDISELQGFDPPEATLCPDHLQINETVIGDLQQLLGERYKKYVEVSYRLRIVVNLLNELNSTYPTATLHDCDEGSDQNPVRLGKTVLGNL